MEAKAPNPSRILWTTVDTVKLRLIPAFARTWAKAIECLQFSLFTQKNHIIAILE